MKTPLDFTEKAPIKIQVTADTIAEQSIPVETLRVPFLTATTIPRSDIITRKLSLAKWHTQEW